MGNRIVITSIAIDLVGCDSDTHSGAGVYGPEFTNGKIIRSSLAGKRFATVDNLVCSELDDDFELGVRQWQIM
ncbi:hypothetical protein [Lentilactobacillus sp. Marseille-Q4993]|uniref:hypothetical protein n=1 Tax=Lentilactobacillus sp. Marseille-Q4993 TaxID=3039492 RepID=UPI0024BBFEF7|nr:hypothetical protein [Lentilactobacillus sp. Marseille-Q4993]